jgi:hypothetical protein
VIAADATETTKIRSIMDNPGKRCRQRRESPRRDHLRGLLGSLKSGTSADPTIPTLAISPLDYVQDVAGLRHPRDHILLEAAALQRLRGHLLRLERRRSLDNALKLHSQD